MQLRSSVVAIVWAGREEALLVLLAVLQIQAFPRLFFFFLFMSRGSIYLPSYADFTPTLVYRSIARATISGVCAHIADAGSISLSSLFRAWLSKPRRVPLRPLFPSRR